MKLQLIEHYINIGDHVAPVYSMHPSQRRFFESETKHVVYRGGTFNTKTLHSIFHPISLVLIRAKLIVLLRARIAQLVKHPNTPLNEHESKS